MKLVAAVLFYFLVLASANAQICLGLSDDGKCVGLSLDGLADDERATNGIQLCAVSEDSSCNGLSIGLLPMGNVSGVAIGIMLGGLGYVAGPESLTVSVNGLAVGITSSIGTCNGLSVSMLNTINKQRGLAVGIVNNSAELHGLQVGMLNYAGNNPLWLRYLPLLNAHF